MQLLHAFPPSDIIVAPWLLNLYNGKTRENAPRPPQQIEGFASAMITPE
jgi:hypothetical protein